MIDKTNFVCYLCRQILKVNDPTSYRISFESARRSNSVRVYLLAFEQNKVFLCFFYQEQQETRPWNVVVLYPFGQFFVEV